MNVVATCMTAPSISAKLFSPFVRRTEMNDLPKGLSMYAAHEYRFERDCIPNDGELLRIDATRAILDCSEV